MQVDYPPPSSSMPGFGMNKNPAFDLGCAAARTRCRSVRARRAYGSFRRGGFAVCRCWGVYVRVLVTQLRCGAERQSSAGRWVRGEKRAYVPESRWVCQPSGAGSIIVRDRAHSCAWIVQPVVKCETQLRAAPDMQCAGRARNRGEGDFHGGR